MPDPTPFDPSLMIETAADGVLIPECTPAHVRALAEGAVAHGHLVVHLHGGLVNSDRGRAGAARLAQTYRDAGGFPVAIIWRTGFGEVFCGNLGEIVREDLFKALLRLVLKYAVGRLSSSAGGKGPNEGAGFELPSDLDVRAELDVTDREPFANVGARPAELTPEERADFEQAALADIDLQDAAEQLVQADAGARGVAGFAAVHPVRTHLDPAVLAELGGGDSVGTGKGFLETAALVKHAGAVLVRVISRFAKGRDHGVVATCVEEIAREFYLADAGGLLWSLIKKESVDTFEEVAGRGGRLFVDELAAAAAAANAPRITVVGHSAGSVFACHLLRALSARGLRVGDLVFLAAAVRYDVFAETHAALRAAGNAPARLHFFGLNEDCESGYWEVPGLYPRSLLYMVSGAAERDDDGVSVADEPLVGMQRFYENPEIVTTVGVHALMKGAASRVWIGRHDDGTVHKHGGLTDPVAAPTVVAAVAAIVGSAP